MARSEMIHKGGDRRGVQDEQRHFLNERTVASIPHVLTERPDIDPIRMQTQAGVEGLVRFEGRQLGLQRLHDPQDGSGRHRTYVRLGEHASGCQLGD